MCIAVPGKIVDIFSPQGKVDIMGVETIINIQLIENPRIGEYVLVHGGCAIEKISKAHCDDLSSIFRVISHQTEQKDG